VHINESRAIVRLLSRQTETDGDSEQARLKHDIAFKGLDKAHSSILSHNHMQYHLTIARPLATPT
jgi:hypothetical protein